MQRLHRSFLRGRVAAHNVRLLARSALVAMLLTSAALPAQAPLASAQVSLDIALAMQLVAQHARDLQADPNAPPPTDAATYSQARALLFKNNALIQEGR